MSDNLELAIRISADIKELKQAMTDARQEIAKLGQNNVGDQADKSARKAKQSFDGMRGAVSSVRSEINSLLGTLATLATLRALGKMADDAATLNARLQIATNSTQELAAAQSELFAIAQRTRSDLKSTIDLYAKLSIAARDLTANQGQLFSVTETVNKAIQLSGVTAESAEAALVQLTQGLASGTLRGDELNSVLEQTPRLARAIAEGMGVTVGELRKQGQEGKITAETIINALLKQKQVIDSEFSKLPPTIGGAFTQLKNSLLLFVGEISKASGASRGFAGSIEDLANTLSSTDFIAQWVGWFTQLREVVGKTADEVGTLIGAFEMGVSQLNGNNEFSLLQAFKDMPANIRAFLQLATVKVARWVDIVGNYLQRGRDRFKAIFTDDTWAEANKRFDERSKAIDSAYQTSIKAILAERNASLEAGKATADAYKKEADARKKAADDAKKDLGTAVTTKKPRDTGKADQTAVLKADTEAALAELDKLYSAAGVKLDDYYKIKRALSAQLIELEIKEVDQKLAKESDADKRSTLLTNKAVIAAKGRALQRQIDAEEAADRKKADEQRVSDYLGLQTQLAEVEGRGADARLLQLVAKYRELFDRLNQQGDEFGKEFVNKLINVELAKGRADDIEKEIQRILEAQKRAEEEIQRNAGALGQDQAAPTINAGRDNTVEQLKQKRQELEQLKNEGVGGLDEKIAQLDQRIAELSQHVPNAFDRIKAAIGNGLVDSFTNLFTDLATGAKSAGEALKDFARNFIASMAQVAARALATWATLQLLQFLPGGSAILAAMDSTARVHHTGGVVGTSGTPRTVPAGLFAAAPRYHSGGVAGLKPGEVPAILQTGEEVLAKNDPRNVLNGGGQQQSGGGVRIVNVIDPALVSDYMTSSAGEQTILNVLQRNSGAVKQVLA